MKVLTIRQAERRHDPNLLHDHLIAQGLNPQTVESDGEETRVYFETDEEAGQAQIALTTYQHREREVPPEIKALWLDFEAALQAATTLPQLKAAFLKMRPVVRALARGQRGELDGS